MNNCSCKITYFLIGIIIFSSSPAMAETAVPGLWLASGIPQRLQASRQWETEYWRQKHGDKGGLRIPNVVESVEKCRDLPWPAYFGRVDPANGYLQLTRCIPDETVNDTDTITAAQFSAASQEPVFISTNKGHARVWGNPIHTLSASKPIIELLPPGFSALSFTRAGTEINTGGLIIFYLDLELPRHGTEVLAHIRLIPIGLKIQNNSPVISSANQLTAIWPGDDINADYFEFAAPFVSNADKTMLLSAMLAPYFEGDEILPGIEQVNLEDIPFFLQEHADPALPGKPWPALSQAEKLELAQYLAANLPVIARQNLPSVSPPSCNVVTISGIPDNRRDFFIEQIEYMHMLESAWNRLQWETLVLGWDKARARFYIKQGRAPARRADFISRVIPVSPQKSSDSEDFFEWARER